MVVVLERGHGRFEGGGADVGRCHSVGHCTRSQSAPCSSSGEGSWRTFSACATLRDLATRVGADSGVVQDEKVDTTSKGRRAKLNSEWRERESRRLGAGGPSDSFPTVDGSTSRSHWSTDLRPTSSKLSTSSSGAALVSSDPQAALQSLSPTPVRPPCHRLLALAKSFRPRAPQRERFTHARTGAVIAGRGGDGLRCWNAGTRDTTGSVRRMPTRRAPEPPELSSWEAAQGRRPGLSPRPCVFCLNGMPLLDFVDVGAASPARLS